MSLNKTILFIYTALLISPAHGQPQWTLRNPLPTGEYLQSVIWTGDQLITVGSTGAIQNFL